MSITILHNPRCSKSRQTLALVEEQGAELTVREYLKEPLSADELRQLIAALGVTPIDLVRTKEDEFKLAGLTKESSADALIDAMVEYPKLMERPVVINGDKARIGRPPEQVLEIL
ncbi:MULTISPECIES: arsenate reductase (glutaredoxin) [unclassified Marinobacterium]|jgi:arsenate reductase (glutaredoxin)|uniref:arsenate reductase (glutaredoxin) n=1 Tax=unclassified Marinobacterium TaxID=2644139 RepID=UPI001569E77C|nr:MULTISPECIES: arsenate reductase (glutaredoxin) [unclassified Marinobacterium]NRP11049.1 Arsenate reductase [Marinobacterium sp. xm-g-48]NRP36579.1 Arsenate reductase [Marinobacterium sp. xm-d-579]NRP83893.1 Arsenate reductase [Marinobacterium sp. xm-d-509]NRP96069.1 Arsenate reductase [Marinobacterium sp. xm-g-59]NRQ02848.1 Arsenate reductase [Marinobacterium sp. xm-d-530]